MVGINFRLLSKALATLLVVAIGTALGQVTTRRSESSVMLLDTGERQPLVRARHLTVEVGDSTRASFEPSFKITAWDGQIEFRVTLASARHWPGAATRMVTQRNNQSMTRLTTAVRDHELYVREDGNLEWNVILKARPQDTVFRYGISLAGARVFYQPGLTPDEIAGGATRPDSVIGSYAVYHTAGRGNIRYRSGLVREYRSGKAFHIYRPRAWDAAGDTVWAALAIDTTVDSLTLTLNGQWLAEAVYPVTLDPTFGATTMGASSQAIGTTDVLHCRYATSTSTGTLDNITWGLNRTGSQPNVGYAMYEKKPGFDACSLLVDTSTTQYALPFALLGTWYGLPVSENASLAADTDYWLSLGVEDASCNVWYDDTDADTTAGHQNDPWPFNNPCSTGWIVYASNRTYSVYGTFTCDNCAITRRRRRMLGP